MAEIRFGIYETIISETLQQEIAELIEDRSLTRPLKSGESSDRIAQYFEILLRRVIENIPEQDRVTRGVEIVNDLVNRITQLVGNGGNEQIIQPANILRSIRQLRIDGTPIDFVDPLLPLRDTALLTNAPGEPGLWNQLLAEIDSADEIDVVMAFIRKSGINPLLQSLGRHCASGKRLRVLTTTYTNSTEKAALDLLEQHGAEIKISYDITSTRLHAKAWCFYRHSGYPTAYVGSSNLTYSAQVTGLEWNIRVSGTRNPDIISKFGAVFESYWQSDDFIVYDPKQFKEETERQLKITGDQVIILPGLELRPEPFQERLLELIAVARQQGHHRNLLVSATGTGKTVMAAVDYARLQETLPRARLLFVAHREEILDQSMATFRYAMRDPSFGEKWVGKSHPTEFEYVFASVQMLSSLKLSSFPRAHFDVVIIDEFHHAAAASYVRLLQHVEPGELLGLTATPERSDGQDVFQWFDNRIAAELRLWDAIDQGRLVPFVYYGIHDGLDLTMIPWRRGQGYDTDALSNLYTSTDSWARLVVKQLVEHVESAQSMRCLGFCVSIQHARFMAQHFNASGITATAVWGESSENDRSAALRDLRDGKIKVIFSVDLFNEGLDVPNVDTILMLRPTESPTLFMQQLGRGLRRSTNKTICTVLDFVGTHRKEFRYDRRFRALLGGTRKELEKAVNAGFPYLPAGCFMHLDRKSSEIVLKSLRSALPSLWKVKAEELRVLAQDAEKVSLTQFLDESGFDLTDIYDGQSGHGWSALCEQAGILEKSNDDQEFHLRRPIGRLLHVDDAERLDSYRALLTSDSAPEIYTLSVRQRRLLRMLVNCMTGGVLARDATMEEGVQLLWSRRQVRSELIELFSELDLRRSHITYELEGRPDLPLQVHARYTRREILAAMGEGNPAEVVVPEWREGVRSSKSSRTELFAFTLDKSSDSFSPSTRYHDYAISSSLIHWESQSTTSAESPTGRRYREHVAEGRSIFLFSRLRTDDRAFWFLGPGTYRGHVGEKPMAVTWELDYPLSSDLFVQFAAAVA
jgi:superfamily II DNA or RNA helicase